MTLRFSLSPAILLAVRSPLPQDCISPASVKSVSPSSSSISLSTFYGGSKCAFSISQKNPKSKIRCDVSVESTLLEAEEDDEKAKVGARVRVKVALKVYNVPEVELKGMEGLIKDYVALWKGKRISANLPYKVQFVKEIEGRGPVKFFTHLKEDEFEFIDDDL